MCKELQTHSHYQSVAKYLNNQSIMRCILILLIIICYPKLILISINQLGFKQGGFCINFCQLHMKYKIHSMKI